MSGEGGKQVAVDHTASKKQDPIRTPPRSDARPGQYWAGGPPGNTKELTASKPRLTPDSEIIETLCHLSIETAPDS